MPMSDSPTPTTSVQVMSRMFALLDVLAREGQAVSLKVASERTGLHPSTAHRILNDLASGGLVERSGPGHYRLGMRLLTLGNLVKSRLDVREQRQRGEQHGMLDLVLPRYELGNVGCRHQREPEHGNQREHEGDSKQGANGRGHGES